MKDRSGAEGFIQHAAKMKLFTFSTIVHKMDAGTAIPAGKNSALRWGEVEFRVIAEWAQKRSNQRKQRHLGCTHEVSNRQPEV
jgi:hypothetical protein